MKIDKRSIGRLTSQSDEKMWNTLRFYAAALGVEVPRDGMNREKIQGLRVALDSLTEQDLERLGELMDTYRAGKRGGRP